MKSTKQKHEIDQEARQLLNSKRQTLRDSRHTRTTQAGNGKKKTGGFMTLFDGKGWKNSLFDKQGWKNFGIHDL